MQQRAAEPDFDMDKYIWLLDAIACDTQNFDHYDNFTEFCRETTKIFMQMGGILKKAFEDITAKCRIMDNNHAMHSEVHGGILNFILLEKSMDVHTLNGQNSDHFKGTDREFYLDYESTARTMLRLMWFLDFVYALIENLNKNEKWSLGSCCQQAYDDALGPHHPMAIRMGVKAGLLVVGGRDSLYKILFKKNENPKETFPFILEKLFLIRKRLWDFYKKEQLTELP